MSTEVDEKNRTEDPNVKAFAATGNEEENELASSLRSVLSIQSTVVYGICGNKAATFPMQLFGFDVSPINTVQFSNHTGYPTFRGSTTTGDEMNELVSGMTSNNLLKKFEYIVSGYMGSVSIMKEMPKLFKEMIVTHGNNSSKTSDTADTTENTNKITIDSLSLMKTNELSKLFKKNVFFACDPACGDNGRLYSDAFLPFIPIYYNDIIPYSTLVTPNQTEAVYLINSEFDNNNNNKKFSINSLLDGFIACLRFHNMGVRFVVITSIDNKENSNIIDIIYSDFDTQNDNKYYTYGHVSVNKISGYYVGTGDLTTALLFGWINALKSSENINKKETDILDASVLNTMKSLQLIIKTTQLYNSKELVLFGGKDNINNILSPNENYTKWCNDGKLIPIKAEKIKVERSKVDQIYQKFFPKK